MCHTVASSPGVMGMMEQMVRAGALEKALAGVTWPRHMKRWETPRQIVTWHAAH